jgi:regulator of sigma E protease
MIVIQNILWLLVLIGVMIMMHEAGHFWAARWFGVRVEVFSFGFGPRVFGFRRGNTDYRFSAILFGGYVKMTGEQPDDESADDPNSFLAKPRWQRLIIAFAGPFMNVVLAVGLLTGLFMVKYEKLADSEQRAVIGYVFRDSAAAKAGIQEGDTIVRFDGRDHPTWENISLKEISSAGRAIPVTIERNGKQFDRTVTPVLDDQSGVGFVGWSSRAEVQVSNVWGTPAEKAGLKKGDLLISINGHLVHSGNTLQDAIKESNGKPVVIEFVRDNQRRAVTLQPEISTRAGAPQWMIGVELERHLNVVTTRLSLPEALHESIQENVKGAAMIFTFLHRIIERRMSPKSLEGPIRIAQLSGAAAREGPSAFIMLMSMVSLNLAIFNLLPIPILDGGVLMLLLVEMFMGRDLSLQVKEAVFKVGFVFLMVVVAFVIYNDIAKLLPAG